MSVPSRAIRSLVSRSMMFINCPHCRAAISENEQGGLPPWCRSCGADIKVDQDALRDNLWTCTGNKGKPASQMEPVGVGSPSREPLAENVSGIAAQVGDGSSYNVANEWTVTATDPLSANPTFPNSVEDELTQFARRQLGVHNENRTGRFGRRRESTRVNLAVADSRFATHNAMAGLGLAAWGFVAAAMSSTTAGQDKFLSSFGSIHATVDILQVLLIGTAFALVVSGIGIKNKASWGFPLATICGGLYILGGATFVVSWLHIKNSAQTVEESVAVVSFVRNNMDMLAGFIDGFAVLYLLLKCKQGRVLNEYTNM